MQNSDKKMFKVISAVKGRDGKTMYWSRVGTAWRNQDDSLNVYLDSMPKTFELQIRELNAEDLRRREEYRASQGGGARTFAASERGPQMAIDSTVPF